MGFFDQKKGVQFINGFQLHNLINNQVGFILVNLSCEFEHENELVQKFISYSKSCSPDELQKKLEEWMIDKAHPVVLIHVKEKVANKCFHNLNSLGLVNLYVVEGGWGHIEEYSKERLGEK
ncbi:MAG: hypothetical protein R2827_11670 [Bdellovibrionales bacterium]